jgi:ribose-phosphate pyrophosphokinase
MPLLIALPGSEALRDRLADLSGLQTGLIETRPFPDGETYLRYKSSLEGRTVILVCSFERPNDKFLPLAFAAAAARDLGATNVGLVSPYLPYLRQDTRFHPGEAVTSKHFADLVSPLVDWLITVDPHLHRYRSLDEIYGVPSTVVHAAPFLSQWVKANVSRPLLIGPDSESEQWVSLVARGAEAPYVVLEKRRRGDRDVEISLPEISRWKGHRPVLVDDIASTARTMIEAAGGLKKAGMPPPICLLVHGLFSGTAYQQLMDAGVASIITSNTVPHPSNAIDMTPALLEAVKKMIQTNRPSIIGMNGS